MGEAGPETVAVMDVIAAQNLRLGDIVKLQDGKRTVRSVIDTGTAGGRVVRAVVLDDCRLALTIPAHPNEPYGVYVPHPKGLGAIAGAAVIAEGISDLLPPHLPPAPNTTGPLPWRLVTTAGQADPLLLLYRAQEVVVLWKIGVLARTHLFGRHLPPTVEMVPLGRQTWQTAPGSFGTMTLRVPAVGR